jgi:hypothetical protein
MAKEWRYDALGDRAIKVTRTDAGVDVWTFATAGATRGLVSREALAAADVHQLYGRIPCCTVDEIARSVGVAPEPEQQRGPPVWRFTDESYGTWRLSLVDGQILFDASPTERGSREMGFRGGFERVALEAIKGEVPTVILDQIAAALRS